MSMNIRGGGSYRLVNHVESYPLTSPSQIIYNVYLVVVNIIKLDFEFNIELCKT